jgi:hypothetical protein
MCPAGSKRETANAVSCPCGSQGDAGAISRVRSATEYDSTP